jgi:glutaredoxin 3
VAARTPPEVVIYTSRTCGYCHAAKRFLRDVKGVPFREVDVSFDTRARERLVEQTGMTTVPQIFVGSHHVGGYDDMRELDSEGGLDPLLAEVAG